LLFGLIMTKVQFNPSTLKALFNPVTKKVLVVKQYVFLLGGSSLGVNVRKYSMSTVFCGTVWSYDIGSHIKAVAVGSDGFCYVGGNRINNKSVWKFTAEGLLVWSFDTGGDVLGIAVDYSGNVYAVGQPVNAGTEEEPIWQSVWKINPNGQSVAWTYFTGNSTNSVAVDDNFNVYVGGAPAELPPNDCDVGIFGRLCSVWKLSSSGNLKWAFGTNNLIRAVAVDDSHNVYAAGERENEFWDEINPEFANIWKINSSGTLVWWYDTGSDNLRSVAVDSSKDVYTTGTDGTDSKTVWKLNSSGELQWSFELGTYNASTIYGNSLAITESEDRILVGDNYRYVRQLKVSDGSEIVKCAPESHNINSVAITPAIFFVISGTVKEGGNPLADVTMTNLTNNPLTDEDGFYAGLVSAGWTGTVTPEKDGYTFDPANRAYSNVQEDKTNQDYAATAT